MPASPRVGHLERGGGQAGRPHVLDGDDAVAVHQLEAGLDQQLLGERVADLDRGPLGLGLVAELGRGHGGAVDAVAPGLGADIDHGIPDAAGLGVEDPVGARDADAHGVDQDVAVVGAVEGALAADGRHADAVAVAADAGDDAAEQVAGLGVRRIAEAQGVEQRHRPRTHGEHVAQDAADAGRRALVGLDERGVVVALHLEDGDQAVADVDHAGVLARAADHPGGLGRELAEVDLRGFVGAVLAPHHREDAELDQVRRAAEDLQDALVLVGLEPVLGDDLRRDRRRSCQGLEQGAEQRQAVAAAEQRVDRALGMGHQAQHVALGPEHAGDVGGRAVGVVAVAEGDAVLVLEPLQRRRASMT